MEILDGIERENAAISMDSLQRNCGIDVLPRGDQGEHAARRYENERLLAELAKTESPMSCPARPSIVLALLGEGIERALQRIDLFG